MSVDPSQMSGGGVGTPDPSASVPPGAAPMASPSPQAGMKEQAKVQVQMAMKVLERTLPAFGFDSEEGKVILDMLQKATKAFGKTADKSQELMPNEIKSMMSSMSGGGKPGAPPPGAGQMPQVQMPQMPQ